MCILDTLSQATYTGMILTEKSMFFLSWFTALGSDITSVCLTTLTLSPMQASRAHDTGIKTIQLHLTVAFTIIIRSN